MQLYFTLWDTVHLAAHGCCAAFDATFLMPAPDGQEWVNVSGPGKTLAMLNGIRAEVDIAQPMEVQVGIARRDRWDAIKSARDSELLIVKTKLPSTQQEVVWDCDLTSKDNMRATWEGAERLGDQAPPTVEWKMHDNTFVAVTAADIKDAYYRSDYKKLPVYGYSFRLEAQINEQDATVESINAVVWAWEDDTA